MEIPCDLCEHPRKFFGYVLEFPSLKDATFFLRQESLMQVCFMMVVSPQAPQRDAEIPLDPEKLGAWKGHPFFLVM